MYKCVEFVSRNMNPLTTTVASMRAMNKSVDIVLKKFSHYQKESETLTTSTEQVTVDDDARFSVKSTVQNMGDPPDQKDLKSALMAISNRMYTPEGVYLSENQARALISYVASGWECVGCGPTIGTNKRDIDGTIWPCSGGGCANFEPVFCLQLDPAPVQPEAGAPPKFKKIVDHSTHGRGDYLSGPDDADCECRNTSEEKACAMSGCGFCSAARAREKLFVRPTAEQAGAAADFIESLVQKGLFGFVNGVFQGTVPLSRFIARREQELRQRSVAIGIANGKEERDALREERDAALAQVAQLKALIVDGRKAVLAWVKDPWLEGRRKLGLDFLAATKDVVEQPERKEVGLHFNDGAVMLDDKKIGGMWINPNHAFRDSGNGACDLCCFSQEQCANFPGRTAPCSCDHQPQTHAEHCPLNQKPG